MSRMTRVYLSEHIPLEGIFLLSSEKPSSLSTYLNDLTSFSTAEINIPTPMAVYLQGKNLHILTNQANLELLTQELANPDLDSTDS